MHCFAVVSYLMISEYLHLGLLGILNENVRSNLFLMFFNFRTFSGNLKYSGIALHLLSLVSVWDDSCTPLRKYYLRNNYTHGWNLSSSVTRTMLDLYIMSSTFGFSPKELLSLQFKIVIVGIVKFRIGLILFSGMIKINAPRTWYCILIYAGYS